MASIVRSGAWDLDRRGPALDRRPVPASEDRRGPHGRDPRVHGRERLHHEGRRVRTPRVHPERDRRRGAPSRLAPERVLRRLERGEGCARRRRGAGGDGVRGDARPPRVRGRAPRRGGAGARRQDALDPPATDPRRLGADRRPPDGGCCPRSEPRGRTGRRLSAADVLDYGRSSSWSRPVHGGAATGVRRRRTNRSRARRTPPARPDARTGDGREASARWSSRRLRRGGLLRRAGHRGAARGRGSRGPPRHVARRGVADLRPDARGPDAA